MDKPDIDLTEQDILSWFRDHPNQWQEMPELRALIENPSQTGKAEGPTSLADFQLRRLRQENTKLQAQLQSLVAVAQTNEQLMRRLHRMILGWAVTPSITEFVMQCREQLCQEFGADAVYLHLYEIPQSLSALDGILACDRAALDWLDPSQPEHAQCGRFTQAKLATLFPETNLDIESAAVIALQPNGWLAIGSMDESKFQPDMGTLFLELLADTISHRLSRIDDET